MREQAIAEYHEPLAADERLTAKLFALLTGEESARWFNSEERLSR